MATLLARLSAAIPLRQNRGTRLTGFGLLALAAFSCLLSLAAFSQDTTAPAGWLPYVGSVVFFMIACYLLVPYRAAFALPDRVTGLTLAAGLFILALGLFLRLYRLDVQPFGIWSDEVDIGLIATRLLNNPDFRPFIVPDNQTPLHFFALVAASFQLLGKSTIAIRVVTVGLGVASIALAFLAGREAYGKRFGLLFAFAVAVAHWHVNFSRFGVYTMSVSCFGLLAIWFLLRARRTRQLHDFAWAGLALGFGLNFYIAARLLVVVLALYLGYEGLLAFRHKLAPAGTKPYSRSTFVVGLIALLAAAWLSIAPLIQYSVTYPDLYWGRSNDVSIFTRRDEPDLTKAIYKNTVAHLLMFNYHGDNNGRHNLPGEPMLDPAMGVLFVLGLALAITRFRNPINLLMLVLFAVGLSGGILSLDFEAPQSTRAFNAVIPVLYFTALTAETLWRGVDHLTVPLAARRGALALAVLALGSYMIYSNAETYFVRQASNDRVWYEYNGTETAAAYRMKEAFAAGDSIYGSVYLNNHIVIQFLAPEIAGAQTLIPPTGFPLSETGDKSVDILVDRSSTWILDQIKLYYPNAQTRIDTAPSGDPALYTVTIPASDIQRLQGAATRYWAGTDPAGEAQVSQINRGLAADWTTTVPLAEPFVAQWDGTLIAPRYGPYEFNLQAPADASVWIDNQLIISGSGQQSAQQTLAAGLHALRVQAAGGTGPVELTWRQPDDNGVLSPGEFEPIPDQLLLQPELVPVRGLLGTYYQGETTAVPPAFTRIDSIIDMYIHLIPLPRPYTVEWTGQIDIPTTGEWKFGLDVNGEAELLIDDQTVLNTAADLREGGIHLTAGPHRLRLHFLDNVGGSAIHLYWTAPNGERQIVPTTALEPLP